MKSKLRAVILSTMLASGLALSGAQAGQIFVSCEKDDVVTVLDADSLELIKRIPTGRRPRDMHLAPDGRHLYVIASDDERIELVDLERLEVVDHIPAGEDPEMFAVSPDGSRIYVSNEEDAEVSVIDPAAGTIVDTVEVGEEPEGVLMSHDGGRLFVTSEVANMVHILDLASLDIEANVLVGNRPRRFALKPDGSELWVTNELSGSVSIIDPDGARVLESISFLPRGFRPEQVTPVAITMDAAGETAYVTLGRANHVAVVAVASREIRRYILVGERAWGAALDSDQQRLFVANGLSDDISVIDLDSLRVTRSVPVGRVPHTVVVRE